MSSMASNSYSNILNIIVICIFSLVPGMVDSEFINVGEFRWTDSTDYVSWARQYNFTVGDVLVFSYTPGAHNVLDVTQATFRSCNASTGVHVKYESGNDQIVLKEAEPYWFICTVDNHCGLGMKLAINVTKPVTNLSQSGLSPSVQPFINDTQAGNLPANTAPGKLLSSGIVFVAAGVLPILTIFG